MRSLALDTQQIAALTGILCLASLPAAAAQLYSTHAGFYTESSLVWFGPASNDWFGFALATGDFNGDGADDLATGIPDDDNAGGQSPDSGIVTVRYGVQAMGLAPGAASAVLSQMNAGSPDAAEGGDWFGVSLAVGDFDGDGYDDLAVGVLKDPDSDGFPVGAVQVHHGSAAGLDRSGAEFFTPWSPGIPDSGTIFNWWFGRALAAGDFDDDGYDDLAIGQPLYTSDFDDNCGRVVIVYGTAAGLTTARTRNFTQDHPGMDGSDENDDVFGSALASGDFNGDSFADLAVGVPGENDGAGGVQVIMGSASGLTAVGNALWTQNDAGVPDSDEPGDDLGYSLAVADFNGDGYDDIAAGVPNEDLVVGGATANEAGAVLLFFGSPTGISGTNSWMWTASTTLGTSESVDYWGNALAAGDFNGDGYADLAVGAEGKRIGSLDATGEVTILPGYPDGVSSWGGQLWHQDALGVPEANEAGDYFGHALASGDFDGNGFADLVIGAAPESTGTYTENGAETVLYGYLFADGLESGNTAGWQQTQSAPLRGANALYATTAAKLGTPWSQNGLRVTLVDGATNPTYVMAGPARGFANETRLTGSFFIDPQGLTMSTAPGAGAFQMFDFRDGTGAGSQTRLAFDLDRNVGAGGWAINAFYWNDRVGSLQLAGAAFFAAANDPSWRNNRIDFEWRAGNPGHLTMWRTRYVNGAPASARVQMVSADLPGMQNAVVNNVYVGMLAGQDPGTFGALFLDEISFGR